jgi:hypothetical protein
MADSIATTGGEGLLMRYDSPTGNWVPVDKYGQSWVISLVIQLIFLMVLTKPLPVIVLLCRAI